MTGQIKHDPVTGAVAIRTTFPDEPAYANLAWLVATPNLGPRHASSSEVADWPDLYTPEGS